MINKINEIIVVNKEMVQFSKYVNVNIFRGCT